MKFTKIKLKDGKIHLEYERELNPNTVKKTIFDSWDEPEDSFGAALQALALHVEELLEMPKGYLSGQNPAGAKRVGRSGGDRLQRLSVMDRGYHGRDCDRPSEHSGRTKPAGHQLAASAGNALW